MAEKRILSLRELELMQIKKDLVKKVNEPTFIKMEIISILKALGCKNIERWMKPLKNNLKLSQFGIFSRNFKDFHFYLLTDVWDLLLNLSQQGKINLKAAGLNNPEDLAAFEIPLYKQDKEPNVGFSYDTRGKEKSPDVEGFWDNAIKAIEG